MNPPTPKQALSAILIAAIIAAAACGGTNDANDANDEHWRQSVEQGKEYITRLFAPAKSEDLQEWLNQMNAQGYELIQIYPTGYEARYTMAVMKRQ